MSAMTFIMEFVQRIARAYGISANNLIVKYLQQKTRAADRGSKSRRSLGNLYALYVVAEDFLEGRQSRFTDLLGRMRKMPFGAKLQNHPLDNRLNDEFSIKMGVSGSLLPIRTGTVQGAKSRSISTDLLTHDGSDETAVASMIIEVVNTYVSLITDKQLGVLDEIGLIADLAGLQEFLEAAFAPKADARLFEISSFALLAEHYRGQLIWIGETENTVHWRTLSLFRTGRTNANDGGIDFVLKPIGRFYQVTETLDFSKYFLDLDKVNRFPISFVVKTGLTPNQTVERIRQDAVKSSEYTPAEIESYISLFEEVFTLPSLRVLVEGFGPGSFRRIKEDLILQFQLEYGLLD